MIYRDFAGERRRFELRIGQVRSLETFCRAGIAAILGRLGTVAWHADDVRQTIFEGLRGGGMGEPEATRLLRDHVDAEPLARHLDLAAEILVDFVEGLPDAESAPGKAPAESGSPATSPPSTAPAARWD